MFKRLSVMLAVCAASGVSAESLRFESVNPSFGGPPLNGSHLLGLANRQFTAPVVTRTPQSDLEYFAAQIQRRSLSAIASAITANVRNLNLDDPDAPLPDNFTIGNFSVLFDSVDGNVVVTLIQDGETIEIIIPEF
jgi:curli production assembly/transport component CsgF